MWFTGKVDLSHQKEVIFSELMNEVKSAAPGARLSYNLRARLERFAWADRREIACRVKDGCAPLFIACKRGHVEIVEYLISTCDADIEQRGLYEVPDDRSVHNVTPLWCAAVSGKLPVIRCLVHYGADVNAVSDTGSTPVRSACFMTHLDIVSYLVECGADILKSNYNGGTCLINSVQSVQLCLYLLQHGANVNARDIQNKTALHYAIQEHRFETTKLLLDHGADPHARSRYNDDALQTSCLKGAAQIFQYLIERISYDPERLADAHELIGSTFLDEHVDTQVALSHWEAAVRIRNSTNPALPKRPSMPPRPAFGNAAEFTTDQDLLALSVDLDAMRTQSLLVCERVLGPYHKDTLFRLMYRGAAYADDLRYQKCIDLWRRALEIRVEKDSILYSDTCFTAQALVRLFIDLNLKNVETAAANSGLRRAGMNVQDPDGPKFQDVYLTFKLLSNNIAHYGQLLTIRPVYKRQQESFDRILKCLTHLIYLLVETANTEEEQDLVREGVTELVKSNPHSAPTGDTLLHLSVSRLNTIKSSYFTDDNQLIFPSMSVIKLLLECGAPVNARNESKSTPLHVAANPYNFYNPLVELLLDHGAHLDQPNRARDCPLLLIAINPMNTICLLTYSSLKCLAATAVVKHGIPYRGQIPQTLETFVNYHDATF
ncbi:ankyrin repeat protein mann-cup [Rhodnius prolixus]|uniref:ankyrin repeat protein mann-cup n=1 Tax=Rhodnius prolixus TaxID=13249 RepID=UPI003D18ED1C